jgi:predicted chitinase
MSGYIDTLSPDQKNNVVYMIQRMHASGITNPMTQAGILAVASKESSFIPKWERDYSSTDNSRIRKIFGSRVENLTEDQLTKLKKDPKAFFDKIYGGRYGNAYNEGYKYRGGGLNQLTFKANYEKVGKEIGVDLVGKPELINTMPVATDALIGFFKRKFREAPKEKLQLYNMTDINSAKTIMDAVGAAYHANTGWGKSKSDIEKESTGGYKKAIDRVNEFYEVTSKKKSLVPEA